MVRLECSALLALIFVGCSARTLDVGSGSGPGATGIYDCSHATVTPLHTWTSPGDCASGPQQSQFLGEWEGSIAGASSADEASTFRLNVTGATDTKICGTLTFGVHAPLVTLPPVTGPDEIYPPDSILPTVGAMSGKLGPILGLPYAIQNGTVQGQHVIFFYSLREIFADWCALQTPYAYSQYCESFGCLPGNAATINLGDPTATCSTWYGADGAPFYTSCWKVMMCGSLEGYACSCNSQHCEARFDALSMSVFDITFNGEEAFGTPGNENVTITMHRVYTTDN